MPNLFAISGVMIAASSLLMALLMFLRGRRKEHYLWGVFCLSVMVWGLGAFFIATTDDIDQADMWWRVTHVGVILIPILFTHFVYGFLKIKRSWVIPALYALGGFFLYANLATNWFIANMRWVFDQFYFDSPPGPVYIPFTFFFFGLVIYSHYRLWTAYRTARGTKKTQIKYFFYGMGFSFAGGSLSFLPVYNIDFYPVFNILVSFYPGIVGYAIIKHRLMDIRVAVRTSIIWLTMMGLSYAAFYAVAFTYQETWGSVFAQEGYLAGIFLSFVFAIVFTWTQSVVQKLANRYLYAGIYNAQRTLEGISRKLGSIIDLKELLSLIKETVASTLGVDQVRILLKKTDSLPEQALIGWLKRTGNPVVLEEIDFFIREVASSQRKVELEKVKEDMVWLNAAVAVPLVSHNNLIGIIILGEKLNNEAYSKEDIRLLASVGSSAAVAIENAQLYEESQEFGRKLEREVEEATKELETANVQLKNLDKAKSEFLSIASHQLYTPLTAIRGYLSMLTEGDFGKIPGKQKEVVEILEKSSTRLIELIKNLLDISRIEAGRLELKLEQVDLVQMAKELVQDLMPNAMAKELQLEFHEPQQPVPNVIADRERLRQVVLNFIDNSIKYTDRGRIDVKVQGRGDQVEFAVSDTGKGMTQEEVGQLFNKFTRVGGASRFHTEGTGLGLYVARQIVREHHGNVEAKSPGKNKGSTFSMAMPAENSPDSLKIGEHATVEIKAAEAKKPAPSTA